MTLYAIFVGSLDWDSLYMQMCNEKCAKSHETLQKTAVETALGIEEFPLLMQI